MPDIILSAGISYPLKAPDGTAAAPSYSFSSDTGMGFYDGNPGGNQIYMASSGAIAFIFASGGQITMGSGTDLYLSRTGSQGGLIIGHSSGNGQSLNFGELAENVIIAAAATSTSVIQLPAGAILLGVTSRVTTIGSASWPATYSVAVGSTTVSTGIATSLNTTSQGTTGCPTGKVAATAITITPNTTPGDALGRIRCTIHFMQLTPATS